MNSSFYLIEICISIFLLLLTYILIRRYFAKKKYKRKRADRKRIAVCFLLSALALSLTFSTIVHPEWYSYLTVKGTEVPFDYDTLPEYENDAYIVINNNRPYFTEDDTLRPDGVQLKELDILGRCGEAFGILGPENMPDHERGSIGMIKPSGWQTVRYDDLIPDKYLYNRCHLIAFQLSGIEADERDLITGTRYMNLAMLEFENETANYIRTTGNKVLYRVTPVFEGDELVARGVLMEAESIEDDGLSFCVFLYNVQPGVIIDYANGDSIRA